jgi:gamma-glutamyltranspeptidase/glutathione hydrolase
MNLQEAIEAPKFSSHHFPSTFFPHKAYPGLLRIEGRIDEGVRAELAARGHKVELRPPWCEGRVLATEIDRRRGILLAGADPRGQASQVMPAQAIGW